MKITEILAEAKAIKQRLDPKCWTGKHKEGTKIKGGVRVNNCVPNEGINEFTPTEKPERDDGQPQFMAWEDFIAAVANLTKSSFDVKVGHKTKKLDKKQAVAKFIPHDPYEHGPVMLYAYKDSRPPHRIGIRAHMQVGTYTISSHNKPLTQYQIPKNNMQAVNMTPVNATMVAHAIMQNTAGALKDGVAEGWKDVAAGAAMVGALGAGAYQGAKHSAPTTNIDGKQFVMYRHTPGDYERNKMKLTTDDAGNKVYAWVTKSGMKPQYTYRYYIPAEEGVKEGWKSAATGAALLGLGAMGAGGQAQAADMNKAGVTNMKAPVHTTQAVKHEQLKRYPTDPRPDLKLGSLEDMFFNGNTNHDREIRYLNYQTDSDAKGMTPQQWSDAQGPKNSPMKTLTPDQQAARKKIPLRTANWHPDDDNMPQSKFESKDKTGPKFTGYWKGTNKGKPGKKMVGDA